MKSTRFLSTSISAVLALAGLAGAFHAQAAPVYSLDPNTEGVFTDIFDVAQGSQVIFSTQQHTGAGLSDPRSAFGFSSGFAEASRSLFADGPGAGTVDFFEWQTAGPVDLSSYELHLQDDGGPARSALGFTLFGSQDGVNFSSLSTGTIPRSGGDGYGSNPLLIADSALTGTTTGLRAFRLETTRASGAGVRVIEMDGNGVAGALSGTFLDRLAFNAVSNTLTGRGLAAIDDEGPGLVISGSVSLGIGSDGFADVFGNNNGAIEPDNYIFADGGAVDNGNGIFGDGGEAVDFLEWHTATPLMLAGFRLGSSGDGGGPARATELVRFFVEGVEVDLFDNNAFAGDVTRLFSGGAVTGDDFRIEFTRTTVNGGRIFEVDAITVPEPSAALSLLLGAGLLASRRRRQELCA